MTKYVEYPTGEAILPWQNALTAATECLTSGTGVAYTINPPTAVPLALETSLEQLFTVTFEEVLNVTCPHLPPVAK